MRLSSYLTLIVNSVILAGFMGYGVYEAHKQTQQRTLEIQRDTINIARSLAVGAAEDLLAENLDQLENLLLRSVSIANLQELLISDAQGVVLVRVQRDASGKVHAVYGNNKPLSLQPESILTEQTYTRIIPIERGKLIGWVSVTAELDELHVIRQTIWFDTLIAGLLISLLAASVLFLKLRRDTRGLELASTFASHLVEKNHAPLQINSPIHEFNELQYALNQAAQLLDKQFAALSDMDVEQKRINNLLQLTVNDLAAKQFALDQHAIVSVADLQGNIVFVNEKFCTISQYTQHELLGQNHRILKSGQHPASFYEDLWQTISTGKVWHGEMANRCKDGGIYWVASTILPLLDINGLPKQYIAIRTDITYRKRTEQQLSVNQGFLEKMVDKFRDAERQISEARSRELAIGSQIQHTLLFGEIPSQLGGLSLAAHTEPSKGIDGDFYQFLQYGKDSFDLSIGDVMGKGIPAALIGAAVKQQMNQVIARLLANALNQMLPSPEAIINTLHQDISPRLIELETFVTLIYLRFDLVHKQITFVDAGHTAALLVTKQGVQALSGQNMPIGVMEDEYYQQHTAQLCAGELLFLYSDGVTEARNPHGEEFGVERLSALLQQLQTFPAAVVLQAVRLHVRQFEQYGELKDDRTCMVLQREHPAYCFSLDWDVAALGMLRQQIEDRARDYLTAEAISALILAAFEAATNVLRHSSKLLPDATLHCSIEKLQHSLVVNLYYLGAAFIPSGSEPDFSGDSDGGFGLYIIENSVDQVSYLNPVENVCWVRLEKNIM